jgi:hypothetical protein
MDSLVHVAMMAKRVKEVPKAIQVLWVYLVLWDFEAIVDLPAQWVDLDFL